MRKKPCNNSDSKLKGVAQAVAQKELEDLSNYFSRRGAGYQFSRRAPSPYKPGMFITFYDGRTFDVGANGYVRFSFEARNNTEAKKVARKYACDIDDAADRLNQMIRSKRGDPGASREVTEDEIRQGADLMYSTLMGADESTVSAAFDAAFVAAGDPEALSEIRDGDRYQSLEDSLPPDNSIGEAQLIHMLSHPGGMIAQYLFQITRGQVVHCSNPRNLIPFAKGYRRLVADLLKRRNGQNVLSSEAADVEAMTRPTKSPEGGWDEAFDSYVLVNRPGEKSLYSYLKAWTTLKESSNCALAQLQRADIVKWRDDLLDHGKKNGTGLERPTVNNYIGNAGTIWRVARNNAVFDHPGSNIFEGLKLKKPKGTVCRARREFSFDELKVLFASPPVKTRDTVSIHSGYWLPMLALYHGARLQELNGLLVSDVVDVAGIPALKIIENERRPSLKNEPSKRTIPLHPKLIELGFLDYVSLAREAKVFALFPSSNAVAKFGEHYVKAVKNLLAVEPNRLVGMHCFRHAWETARRNARMDISAGNFLAGRAIDAGSAREYGTAAGMHVLFEELSKIQFPLDFLPAPPVTVEELVAQQAQAMRNMAAKIKQTGRSAVKKYLGL